MIALWSRRTVDSSAVLAINVPVQRFSVHATPLLRNVYEDGIAFEKCWHILVSRLSERLRGAKVRHGCGNDPGA